MSARAERHSIGRPFSDSVSRRRFWLVSLAGPLASRAWRTRETMCGGEPYTATAPARTQTAATASAARYARRTAGPNVTRFSTTLIAHIVTAEAAAHRATTTSSGRPSVDAAWTPAPPRASAP